MIESILIFNEKKETIIFRSFKSSISEEDIKKDVLNMRDSNITGDIIFKKFYNLYICFVVQNENELYVLGLINYFIESLNRIYTEYSELHFIYKFNEIYDLLDRMFVGGYFIK